ncbi:MAG: hypothetical protein IJ300_03570 [Clostridia bacterium]|nr:hypothetical protein [Clostridia bacterium]
MEKEKMDVMKRFEKIAQKVYRNKPNAANMLINDLEDFFEMNAKDVNTMTSDEFDRYIEGIYNQWEV